MLNSVEISLTSFQKDLGSVSAEIETLQSRSTALSTKLENRKVVEKLLGPVIEDISIAPAAVEVLSEGSIDLHWVRALDELEKRSKAMENKVNGSDTILAVSDIKPLLNDLTSKVGMDRPTQLNTSTNRDSRQLNEYVTFSLLKSKPCDHRTSTRKSFSSRNFWRTRVFIRFWQKIIHNLLKK